VYALALSRDKQIIPLPSGTRISRAEEAFQKRFVERLMRRTDHATASTIRVPMLKRSIQRQKEEREVSVSMMTGSVHGMNRRKCITPS
jgi:hypothetical protein